MPLQKFRTLEEASRALWTTSDDPQLLTRARGLLAFVDRAVIIRVPVGVRKYRSIEEAYADRKEWSVETLFKPVEPPHPVRE